MQILLYFYSKSFFFQFQIYIRIYVYNIVYFDIRVRSRQKKEKDRNKLFVSFVIYRGGKPVTFGWSLERDGGRERERERGLDSQKGSAALLQSPMGSQSTDLSSTAAKG